MNITIEQKAFRRLAVALNVVIQSNNLYSGHSRFICALPDVDGVSVENLQTGERVRFVNDGSFRDGYGNPVKL